MTKVIGIFSVLFIGIIFFSCKKTSTPTPGPPVIAYKSFEPINADDAYLHFTFTDPDGDIGLSTADDSSITSPYHYDFHSRFQFKNYQGTFIDSVWVDLSGADSAQYNYRIPYIENKAKDKSLSGEIIVKLSGYRPAHTFHNFRYNIYIYDRAHHKSNVVTTPEIYYP